MKIYIDDQVYVKGVSTPSLNGRSQMTFRMDFLDEANSTDILKAKKHLYDSVSAYGKVIGEKVTKKGIELTVYGKKADAQQFLSRDKAGKLAYIAEYQKQNERKYTLKLNSKKDADLIAYLDGSSSKNELLREALREKMERDN